MDFSNSSSIAPSEYPRPQLRRAQWLSLNGVWECHVTTTNCEPLVYSNTITVPFSPGSEYSGFDHILLPDEILWYKTTFLLTPEDILHRIVINFGAVDERAEVFINSTFVGSHQGGYESFYFDITDYVKVGPNIITVKVTDSTGISGACYGKQSLNPGGIWYQSMSGIWQTVWLEHVPDNYILNIDTTPNIDNDTITFFVQSTCTSHVSIVTNGHVGTGYTNEPITIKLKDYSCWSPDSPTIYPVSVRMDDDCVESYYAMRKCEVKKDIHGIPMFHLNNKPLFISGVLDQGYWRETLYTPPNDTAIINDLIQTKQLGFNTIRKHAKVEPDRWYWHCDRLGMLVWQDIPNGGTKYNPLVQFLPLAINVSFCDRHYRLFKRATAKSRSLYINEAKEIIHQLKNHPSIITWVPFNEGWGQFDAAAITSTIKDIDPTRPVDHASGWHDQGAGNYYSLHVYFKKYKFRSDKGLRRAVVLSEFGGYSLSPDNKIFSYKKFANNKELELGIISLFKNEIFPAVSSGLAGYFYTQLTDVESEENGLLLSDHKTAKIDKKSLRDCIKEAASFSTK